MPVQFRPPAPLCFMRQNSRLPSKSCRKLRVACIIAHSRNSCAPMHIHALSIKNFRRLKNVRIDLASDISIFVGANNSGKTSASHAFQLFTAAMRDKFSIHDFNTDCWAAIDAFGDGVEGALLPTISLDIWFAVEAVDLHRVIDLLPSLAWRGTLVGLRVEFAAVDEDAMLDNFKQARERARGNVRAAADGTPEYQPLPRTLTEYLTEQLNREFGFRYYVLDRAQFDDALVANRDYTPLPLTSEKGVSGRDILNSLVRVDFLHAQRHLADNTTSSRAEDLSRCLSRFYERNLEKRGDDHDALRALGACPSRADIGVFDKR